VWVPEADLSEEFDSDPKGIGVRAGFAALLQKDSDRVFLRFPYGPYMAPDVSATGLRRFLDLQQQRAWMQAKAVLRPRQHYAWLWAWVVDL
jgi:hypothetical protein